MKTSEDCFILFDSYYGGFLMFNAWLIDLLSRAVKSPRRIVTIMIIIIIIIVLIVIVIILIRKIILIMMINEKIIEIIKEFTIH